MIHSPINRHVDCTVFLDTVALFAHQDQLPCKSASSIRRITAPVIPKPSLMQPKTILVVDDEPIMRDLIRRVNTAMGYETIEAEDGAIGLRLFEEKDPDLTITDIYMPNLNGIQLLRQIRRLDSKAKVILITGYAHFKQLAEDQNSRPDGFLTKPFPISDLMRVIQKAFDPAAPGHTAMKI
jgi:CheY-like chemotaxis protein